MNTDTGPNAASKDRPAKRSTTKSPRRRAREFALQGLYQWLLSRADGAEIEAHLQEDDSFAKIDRAHFEVLLYGCIRDAAELDALLAPHVDRRASLVSPVERAVLMIGTVIVFAPVSPSAHVSVPLDAV